MNTSYFDRFTSFAHGPDLEPARRLCSALGNPERSLRFVHVAGTNGKGSVTCMTASVLKQAGYRVGLFTSPALVDFEERFRINGVPVSGEIPDKAVERLSAAVEALEKEGLRFSYFDAVTAAALLIFKEEHCDVVCWETGLGGRCDATNVIPGEALICSVIVPIGLDHCGVLGNTLGEIAAEKAGIFKENRPAVLSPHQPEEALTVLRAEAFRKGSPLYEASNSGFTDLTEDPLVPTFRVGEEEYRLSMLGKHQFSNALTALAVIERLREQGFRISREAVRAGLYRTQVSARLQLLSRNPLLLMDGAHNPHGASALADYLKTLGRPVKLIIGACSDKDTAGVAALLGPLAQAAACVPVPSPRSLSPEALREQLLPYCECVRAFDIYNEAEKWILSERLEGDAVVICGSLYLCGEVLREKGIPANVEI